MSIYLSTGKSLQSSLCPTFSTDFEGYMRTHCPRVRTHNLTDMPSFPGTPVAWRINSIYNLITPRVKTSVSESIAC